jgi:hypothetical protein
MAVTPQVNSHIDVLLMGAVTKIGDPVIRRVSILMEDFLSYRLRTNERQGDEVADLNRLPYGIPVKADGPVAISIDMGLENSFRHKPDTRPLGPAKPLYGDDIAIGAHSVAAHVTRNI